MVLISPNFGMADPRMRLLALPWAGQLLPLILSVRGFEPTNAAQARYWTTEYPSVALLPLAALVPYVSRQPLESIATPTLTLYSPRDLVIDVERLLAAHARMGREAGTYKELVAVTDSEDPAQHVLAGDILSPATTGPLAARITEFVKRLPNDRR